MTKNSLEEIKSALICEDHPFVQKGLELAVRELLPKIEHCQAVCSGEEAIKTAEARSFGVVFVDIGLPGISGLEVIERLKDLIPQAALFVLTSCDNPYLLRKAKDLGVAAIIHKSVAEENLKFALEYLERKPGQIYLDSHTRALLEDYVELSLTPRESDVLRKIVQGYSNQQIAEKLGCGLTTVRFHRANIMQKTGMKNAAELTAWYLQGQPKRH